MLTVLIVREPSQGFAGEVRLVARSLSLHLVARAAPSYMHGDVHQQVVALVEAKVAHLATELVAAEIGFLRTIVRRFETFKGNIMWGCKVRGSCISCVRAGCSSAGTVGRYSVVPFTLYCGRSKCHLSFSRLLFLTTLN